MPVHFLVGRGGAEYQVRLIMNTFAKDTNYDIHFLCRRVPHYMPKDHTVWKIGSENALGKYGTFFDALRIYYTLRQISPQIIYQNVGSAYTGIAALYARRNGSKLVWHIASDVDVAPELALHTKRLFTCFFDRVLLNYGIRNANIIVAQTQHQNRLLLENFGRKCDAFIPIGHPHPDFEPIKAENFTVLWIGNIKPLKQPEIFVNLAREIGKTTDAHFVMMGQPKTSKKRLFRLMREIDSVPNLTYLGRVPQAQVNRLLCQGHILVNTSQYEGFSNTFVQAWMRQVPVVSLHADPDGVLVREGIGFHSSTLRRLCQDVQVLIVNKTLREQMGKRAQKYAHENHTVQKMVQRFTMLIDSL